MMFVYQPVLLLLTTVATLGKGVNGHTISHDNLRHRPSLLTSSVNREPTTTTTRPVKVEDKESYRNKDVPLVSILSSVSRYYLSASVSYDITTTHRSCVIFCALICSFFQLDAAVTMLDRRTLPSCQNDEQLLRIDLTTDNYG